MSWDRAFAEAHEQIAQGLSGAWWQVNATLSAANSHGCAAEIRAALDSLGSDLLQLLRVAQDAAASFDVERAGRLHIVSALEEQAHVFIGATGANVTLKVKGEPGRHTSDSLTRLYGRFKSELDRLASVPDLPVGMLEVDLEVAEPSVRFFPDGTTPMF